MNRETATRAIVREANEWLVRLQDPESTTADQDVFGRWLRQSPVHVREYLRAEAVWSAMESVDRRRRHDVDALLQDEDGNVVRMELNSGEKREPRMRRRRWIASAAAAGIAALALVGGGIRYWSSDTASYATGVGEQRRLVLDDGSIVDMNTRTELAVRMDDTGRYVELREGEALFEVARDASRPFVVDGELATVRALGTQFNVYRQTDQILVTVIEGRVAVENRDVARRAAGDVGGIRSVDEEPVELAAGHQARISPRIPILKALANVEPAVAWRERRLIFDGQPLSEVVREFNRYNRRQLVIDHPDLADRRISGVFDADQPDALVRFLQQNMPIEARTEGSNRLAIHLHD